MGRAELVEMADKVFADISSDGQSGKPLWPCTTCGKETLEHTPDPTTGAARRICCMSQCSARIAMLAQPR